VSPVGGQAGYTYLWNTGATSPTLNGLSPGSYTVTATENGGCETISTYTINEPIAPTFGVVFSNNELFSGFTGSAYQWYLDGIAIPNANAISVIPSQNGTYHVVVTTSAGCNYSSSSYNFTSFGLDEDQLTYNLYPNPVSSVLSLVLENSVGTTLQVRLMDMTGRVVYQSEIRVDGRTMIEIPMHHLSKGMYLLELNSKSAVVVERISKL
jgi:hypothetical protein